MFVTQGDVGGHLSPLGGLAKDRALVMDVWPQTRFLLGSNNALTNSCHQLPPLQGMLGPSGEAVGIHRHKGPNHWT